MGNITIRNLPDAVHSGLKKQASLNGRSTEAEARFILAASVASNSGQGLGRAIRSVWGDTLGDDLQIQRSSEEIETVAFE